MKFRVPTTEAELYESIRSAALMGGWRIYHTFDSRKSYHGFPDIVAVHNKRRRMVFVELKREDGKLSIDQSDWIDTLRECGADVRVWRPSDLDDAIAFLMDRHDVRVGQDIPFPMP